MATLPLGRTPSSPPIKSQRATITTPRHPSSAPVHVVLASRRWRASRDLAGLRCAKMQRVSQALQLAVVVEGRRSHVRKPQTFQELDFLRGRGAAERGIFKEFLEPRLLAGLVGFPLNELESLRLPWGDVGVQDNLQTERRQV